MKCLTLLLIILLSSLELALAQPLTRPFVFRNGIAPAESNLLNRKITHGSYQALHQGNAYYALTQIEKIPVTPGQRAGEENGIRFFDYAGNGYWLVEFRNEKSLDWLRNAGAKGLYRIRQEAKYGPELFSPLLMSDNKTEVIAVNFFGSMDRSAVAAFLRLAGAQIVDYKIIPARTLFVHASALALKRIAAYPFVSYLSRQSLQLELLNNNNRALHGAEVLSAFQGRNLQGKGVTIGMGDNADPSTHIDFTGRLILRNSLLPATHGTHTTGTAAGAGILNPRYRGMAPKATIISQEFNDILVNSPVFIGDYNMVLTNNSYFQGLNLCPGDGQYDALSNYADGQLLENTSLLHVFAAGNDGQQTCTPYPAGYGTIKSGFQVAKNVLTVGAINNISYVHKPSSSMGPVADGRLKPEIMAGGENIFSTVTNNGYGYGSGTSMAAPTVTGILALLYERYRQLHGGADPPAALIKAIACNSADDMGNPGPDFSYGFGMINGRTAAETIEANRYFTGSLQQGDSALISIPAIPAGSYQLKLMCYWPDQPSVPFAVQTLINDLDLSVQAPDGSSHLPMILDPSPAGLSLPAQEGQDHTNNIEQVIINNPPSGNYTLKIKGTRIPFGNQSFYVTYQLITPSVTVEYPAGNNYLVPGESEIIRWSAYGGDPNGFSVSYSTDNGASWNLLSNSVPSSARSLSFTVPAIPTAQALFRVSRNGTPYTDQSDFPVTILGQPSVTGSNPCPGYGQLSWNSIAAATSYDVMVLKGDSMQFLANTTDTSYLLTGLNKDSSYWFAVRPSLGAHSGRRSIAINLRPSGGACALPAYNNDFSLDSVTAPLSGRMFTSTALGIQPVRLKLHNLGSITASGTFSISFQVNGAPVISESATQSFPAGSQSIYVFSSPTDFSAKGKYDIKAWINFPGDPNHANDTIEQVIWNLANDPLTLNPSFTEDFEAADPATYTSNRLGLSGLPRIDFSGTPNARVRTWVNTGFSRSGKYCATLDQAQFSGPAATDSLLGSFNLSGYSGSDQIWLDYYFKKQYLDMNQAAGIWIRGNDQAAWILADTLSAASQLPSVYKRGKSIDITGILARAMPAQTISSSFQVKFSWNGTGQANDVNPIGFADAGISYDDITLTRATNDLAILALNQPVLNNLCGLGNSEQIVVQVKNYSGNTLTHVPISYSLNGGVTTEYIPSIGPNQSLAYSFTQKADLSAYQDYALQVWLAFPADNYASNDTLPLMSFHTVPLISSYPYLEKFENNDGNWYTAGQNDNWQWGSPAKTLIRQAASGRNAWVTGLTGNYNDNQLSYLYSPCFDLTGLNLPVLSFSHIFQTEDNCDCDYHWVEYSTDNLTWKKLDSGSEKTNWFDDTLHNAWKISDTIWHVSSHDIPVGSAKVRFRFVMYSDPAVNHDGVGIDDIHVFDKTPIADSLTMPVTLSQPVSGNGWVHFDVNGKRMASINPLGQDLGNTTVTTYLHPGAVRDTNNQYYLNRNIVIRPAAEPLSYVLVRFYFLDSEANQLIQATGCSSCTSIADAYESGITQYSSSVAAEEDSSLQNNVLGNYRFARPRQDLSIIPYDKGYYAEYAAYHFSEFWLNGGGSGQNQALPYMLDSFQATRVDTTGLLHWEIFPGSVIDSFVIEKSADGSSFNQKAGSVQAVTNGTDYQFTDFHLVQGLNYYRIRIVTPAGNIQYSPVRVINYVRGPVTEGVFPNPVSQGKLTVNTAANCSRIELYDILGRFLRAEEKSGLQNNFSVSNLPAGVYLLKIFTTSGNQVKKILVE